MSRPTALLLHAFPLDSRMWQPQRAALEEAGWHVVAPDLPGPDGGNALGDWAERVLHVVDGPLVPVGVSMGGYLTFELWRRAAERIVALVLVDTRAGADTPEGRAGREESIRVVCEEGVAELWEGLEPKMFAAGVVPEVAARAREIVLEQGSSRLRQALEALRDRSDSTPLLAEIGVPVLVVVGEEDAITPPAESEAMVAALPDARLVRVGGAGHLTPLERPDDLNDALLSFLAELAERA
jgi:3-oxoadipate enol-lactonase